MLSLIIMLLAGLFGLYQFFRITDKFSRLILIGQLAAIALISIGYNLSLEIGSWLFLVTAIVVLLKAMVSSSFSGSKKVLVILISAPVVTQLIFEKMSWPQHDWIVGLLLISVVSFLAFLFKNLKKKNEIGYLFIIAAHALLMLSWRLMDVLLQSPN